MKKNVKEMLQKGTKDILTAVLKMEANSTSCNYVYQPKEPKQLSKFRRR